MNHRLPDGQVIRLEEYNGQEDFGEYIWCRWSQMGQYRKEKVVIITKENKDDTKTTN